MKTFLKIGSVLFELNFDNVIAQYFFDRVQKHQEPVYESPDVKVICTKSDEIIFTTPKFARQQEPDISPLYMYREIVDLGTFRYNRQSKVLECCYIDSDRYLFNSYEVVVDTILQFMYLIMLDFDIIPIHTAVVSYGNNAVLILGHSGAGKSTLELSLLKNGFDFFSDDVAFLDNNNTLFSSREHIISCFEDSLKITQFNEILNDTYSFVSKESTNIKKTIKLLNRENYPLTVQASILIFPTLSTGNTESFDRISSKSAWINLIQLSISKKFSLQQKQMYLNRLKSLAEATVCFQYNRTRNSENMLDEVCRTVKLLLSAKGEKNKND